MSEYNRQVANTAVTESLIMSRITGVDIPTFMYHYVKGQI